MSYEGYEEYLCVNGHYLAQTVHADHLDKCPICNSSVTYWHPVDQTNGLEEDNPHTYPAPKVLVAEDDEWHEDHYGNKYATKRPRYKPLSEWRFLGEKSSNF